MKTITWEEAISRAQNGGGDLFIHRDGLYTAVYVYKPTTPERDYSIAYVNGIKVEDAKARLEALGCTFEENRDGLRCDIPSRLKAIFPKNGTGFAVGGKELTEDELNDYAEYVVHVRLGLAYG